MNNTNAIFFLIYGANFFLPQPARALLSCLIANTQAETIIKIKYSYPNSESEFQIKCTPFSGSLHVQNSFERNQHLFIEKWKFCGKWPDSVLHVCKVYFEKLSV